MSSEKKYTRSICWLRRDLRLSDHRALFEACRQSKNVLVVFVFDRNILDKLKSKSDTRVSFIFRSLRELDRELRSRGSALVWLYGDPSFELSKLAREADCQAVFTNEDYETYAKKRDIEVSRALNQFGIAYHSFKDHVIFSGDEVEKGDHSPYRKFTPYKRIWLKNLTEEFIWEFKPNLACLMPRKLVGSLARPMNLENIGFSDSKSSQALPGESAAQAALRSFKRKMDLYAAARDFPGLDGTSRMSVHLRFGTISIRACVRACWRSESKGAQVWLNELIWRDFYQMILDHFPYVEKKAFLRKYESIKWPGSSHHFKAWCEGRTGFPIIDAAMRQLNATGFMHNRLRMVAASFLVKDLLIDWRKGEAYFAEKLLDYDKAANNGGWQWCASTGSDAQPYFRIFNSVAQSVRFDEAGEFIRRFVPELRHFSRRDIHCPALTKEKNIPPGFILGKDYPEPIVVHSMQIRKAISLFKKETSVAAGDRRSD